MAHLKKLRPFTLSKTNIVFCLKIVFWSLSSLSFVYFFVSTYCVSIEHAAAAAGEEKISDRNPMLHHRYKM